MNLTNVSNEVETQEFKMNGEWRMRRTTAEWIEIVFPQHPDIRYSKVPYIGSIILYNIRYLLRFDLSSVTPSKVLHTVEIAGISRSDQIILGKFSIGSDPNRIKSNWG